MLRRLTNFFFAAPASVTVTGYLANWKMFDPRKLIPPSIELCSAPIAVITEMTENTPMVIPTMVNAARSLFAPSDAQAIFKTSLNCIFISPQRSRRTRSQEYGVLLLTAKDAEGAEIKDEFLPPDLKLAAGF